MRSADSWFCITVTSPIPGRSRDSICNAQSDEYEMGCMVQWSCMPLIIQRKGDRTHLSLQFSTLSLAQTPLWIPRTHGISPKQSFSTSSAHLECWRFFSPLERKVRSMEAVTLDIFPRKNFIRAWQISQKMAAWGCSEGSTSAASSWDVCNFGGLDPSLFLQNHQIRWIQ